MSSDYYGNVRTLLRFLTRTDEDGYAFATAQHEGLIPAVNRELVQQAEEMGKRIVQVWYETEEDRTLAEMLRAASVDADALIVNDLDKVLREDKNFIINLNFAREALNALGKPIICWLSPESLVLVSNQAADLFSQRRISTVQFEEAPEIMAPTPELERRYTEEYRSSEDYEQLRTRLNLLKKQLAEATEAGIPRVRIAHDIVLPLADTYSELDLHEEALELLEHYQDVWSEEDARELYKRGRILWGGNLQHEALACLQKAMERAEDEGAMELLADIVETSGYIYGEIGQIDLALSLVEKNLDLREQIIYSDPGSEKKRISLGSSYISVGEIYKIQGELNKALEYFEKNNQLFEELYKENPLSESLKTELAVSHVFLGDIYKTRGKIGKALKYFEKYNQLFEELYQTNSVSESLKRSLAISYNRLGGIYEEQGKLSKAFEYFEKYNQLSQELYQANSLSENRKRELAVSYNRLGGIYESQGKLSKALEYCEKYNQLSQQLYYDNPLSEKLKKDLALSYHFLGRIYEMQNKLNKALECFEKEMQIIKELHSDNALSEDLKEILSVSYNRISNLRIRKGQWFKSIQYSWKELSTDWYLCRYVRWERHKIGLLNSFLSLVLVIIFFPPISMIIYWIFDHIIQLSKRLRYGSEKTKPQPPSKIP